jgi:hypothetical protein
VMSTPKGVLLLCVKEMLAWTVVAVTESACLWAFERKIPWLLPVPVNVFPLSVSLVLRCSITRGLLQGTMIACSVGYE